MKNRNYELARKDNEFFGLDPFFDDFFNTPFLDARKSHHPVMKTDIAESDNNYTLTVDVPGFNKEDIELSIDNGYLTIEAKKEDNSEVKKENKVIRQERFQGSYSRSFYVGDLTEDQVEANMSNGVLTITIPKKVNTSNSKKLISIK